MRLAVYNTATGRILRIVVCPDDAASLQAGTGEAVKKVEQDVSDETHAVANGEIVRVVPE